MIFPTFTEFKKKLDKGNLVPVWSEFLADFDTPVSALKKIDKGKYSFLFESVEGGEKWGRYSFLGTEPTVIFRSKGNKIEIIENGKTKREQGNPIDRLRKLMSKYKPVAASELPRFSGGAVGFFSYDIVRFVEDLPVDTTDDLGCWDCLYMITDTILVFDNVSHKIKIISNAFAQNKKDAKKAYDNAIKKIGELKSRISKKASFYENQTSGKKRKNNKPVIKSNFKQKDFKDAVNKTKRYIREGDIIQAVISQRWKTKLNTDPLDLYRALRILNPSPYLFYLKMGSEYLVGSSPEVMVRVEGSNVENRPIAGTRPRGKNESQDNKYEKELLADPKERAEHIMLVDLARNDLGRVAKVGTVKVDEFMTVERYSHVMHIVSNVIAKLKRGKDAFDVIKATYPAGTLSGAPKVRAMEIIEEMESTRRGPYGGAVGYFSFSGNMDTSIVIRTFYIKDSSIYFQAGAGIVADSVPQNEYNECVNKAKALVKAIELTESGL
ncbi:MAG: anthranilate synthase component I [Candidatus Dadabacteria bacterium]|nr:anthranilate synthase component I [Candidatus Dadabacteria bacterium]